MIKLQGVSKYYKTKTSVSEGMRNINLEFKLNEFVAITGESGSGKTTLLNVISGLDSYEDGELFINGFETSHYSVKEWEEFRAKHVGFVFQNYNVIDSYTVYQNVIIALEAQGYDPVNMEARALELIERVGLLSHKNHKTSKLSGGQKQRVVIARALAKNAPIILADEPTGNLDEQSGIEIMQVLKEISQDKLIILVTHNYEEAKPYITRNVVMADGGIKDDYLVNETDLVPYDELVEDIEFKSDTFKTSSKIAIRNLFSTPKRTTFSVILSMISIAIFILFYASLIKNREAIYFGSNEKQVYVRPWEDGTLNKNMYEDLKDTYETNSLKVELSFDDIIVRSYTEFNNGYTPNYDRNYTFSMVDSIDDKYLTGNFPTNKNEVIIVGKNSLIDSKIYLSFGSGVATRDNVNIEEFTIVGVVNSKFVEMYGLRDEQLLFNSNGMYDDDFNITTSFISSDFKINELKVIGSDRQEIDIFSSKLDTSKFRIIDKYIYESDMMAFVNSTLGVFFWVVLLGILSVVFLVLFNVFKNVMQARKKDFAVYRSIGVNEKEVALTILIEQFFIAVISVLLTISILEILSLFLEFIRNITRHVSFFDYIFVAIVFALFSLLLGLRYNKKIFNITVIDSLKEEN